MFWRLKLIKGIVFIKVKLFLTKLLSFPKITSHAAVYIQCRCVQVNVYTWGHYPRHTTLERIFSYSLPYAIWCTYLTLNIHTTIKKSIYMEEGYIGKCDK